MEKLRNLKEHICSFQNLYLAYEEAAEDKRYRTDVLEFAYKLEDNLITLQSELMNGSYRVGAYREFYVHYPKQRLIMALPFRDRIVQWAIYRQLNPFVDKRFITHSYGCRKGKGTLLAAVCLYKWMRHISRRPDAQEWVIIKGDVSKYFYRVDHKLALDVYREYTDDAWFLRLMDRILNDGNVPFGLPKGASADNCPRDMRLYDVGMPIGNLTSQETANMYLNCLDQYCKRKLNLHYYVRYVDDFCIMMHGRKKAEATLDVIGSFLNEKLLLDISPKSQIVPALQGCEFVGYRITPHGMRLRRSTVKHIKSSLTHIQELYAEGAISLDRAMQTVKSYLCGMTKHCNARHVQRWIAENVVFVRGGNGVGKELTKYNEQAILRSTIS